MSQRYKGVQCLLDYSDVTGSPDIPFKNTTMLRLRVKPRMMNIARQLTKAFTIALPLVFLMAAFAQADDYTSGHGALGVWDAEAQANMPQWIKVWLLFMISVFAAGLIFVWKHMEARWLVGGVIGALVFSKVGIPALGWIALSGLVATIHLIFWSPALFFMLKNRPFMQGWSFYNAWSGLATACILFSFIFDIRDSAIYITHLLGLI
jgi:hypothetical protein